MEWITIKQAANISGKTTSTIRNAINKHKRDAKRHKCFAYKQKVSNGRKMWFVDQTSFIEHYNVDTSESKQDAPNAPSNNQVRFDTLIETLKNQLNEKDKQVKELHKILNQKEKNIRLLQVPREKDEKIIELERKLERLSRQLSEKEEQMKKKDKKGIISEILSKYGL